VPVHAARVIHAPLDDCVARPGESIEDRRAGGTVAGSAGRQQGENPLLRSMKAQRNATAVVGSSGRPMTTRRQFFAMFGAMAGLPCAGAAAAAGSPSVPVAQQAKSAGTQPTMQRKPIPSSGEPLPVIGCGTWQGFDVSPGSAEYERLREVLLALFDADGSVVDSSPMYGRAEDVTGRLLEQTGLRDRAFVATKVWTSGRDAGIRQMEESFRLLRTKTIDLMQVHNLVDWRTHLPVLRKWKENGRIRYVGVTHYTSSAYAQLEQVLRSEPLDFVQLNYSIDDRTADERILPLAAERGVAVLVNRPFGGGGVLRSLRDRPLPGWANEIGCESWAQVLLKFVVSHPAVNCAIPGTGNPDHMRANARAGMGAMPDEAMRRRMIADSGFRAGSS